MKIHYAPTLGRGDVVPVCLRGWSHMTSDKAMVTCKWCLRALKVPTETPTKGQAT